MRALTVDVVSLYDFALPRGTTTDIPTTGVGRNAAWDESFTWLFYARRANVGSDKLGDEVTYTLPWVNRIELPALPCARAFTSVKEDWTGSSCSSSILLSRRYRAGVFATWLRFDATGERSLDDVRRQLKKNPGLPGVGDVRTALRSLKLEPQELERHYQFVAVRTDATVDNFAQALAKDRENAGRLFTGGTEHERPMLLGDLVDDRTDLSHRLYERFFLRWTDALALYVADVEAIPRYAEHEYKLAMLRCAHLVETCVLVRRILRNLDDEMTDLSEKMRVRPNLHWPPFGASAEALGGFSDVERDFVVAPSYRSVEGEEMVKAGYRRFGIGDLFDATKKSYELLDDRRRWVTTQLSIAIPLLLTTLVGIASVVAAWAK